VNFKSIVALGLGIATIGLSVPAFADSITKVETIQDAVITGNGNTTVQASRTRVNNSDFRNKDSQGTDVSNRQKVDVLGDHNVTIQRNDVDIRNRRSLNK
jgi:hypothetical protein